MNLLGKSVMILYSTKRFRMILDGLKIKTHMYHNFDDGYKFSFKNKEVIRKEYVTCLEDIESIVNEFDNIDLKIQYQKILLLLV
jgi:hypothetical protein